jgi:hypothetical protein
VALPHKLIDGCYAGLIAQNLRVVYDKNGKKMVSKEGGSGIEDPAGFFANVFGGERFIDYVASLTSPSTPLLT